MNYQEIKGPYVAKYRIKKPDGETAFTVFEREGPLLTPVIDLKSSESARDFAHLMNVSRHDRNNRKAAAKLAETIEEKGLTE
jgi:hypothetical protein